MTLFIPKKTSAQFCDIWKKSFRATDFHNQINSNDPLMQPKEKIKVKYVKKCMQNKIQNRSKKCKFCDNSVEITLWEKHTFSIFHTKRTNDFSFKNWLIC